MEQSIKYKIEKTGVPLKDWAVNIYRGILTGFNDAFIIDTKTKDKLIEDSPNSAEIIRPIIRGRDIKKYNITFENKWIIFTRRGTNIEEYPAIKKHLSKYYDLLKPKNNNDEFGRKPGSYEWFEIQDNVAYYQDFEKEKIVWIELTDKPNFALDKNQFYINNTIFFLTGRHLKYLLAFLNSRLCEWYFDKLAATSGVGTRRWIKIYIDQICIPIPSQETETKFVSLVREIDENGVSEHLLKRIDAEVYKLFFLQEEEIQYLETAVL